MTALIVIGTGIVLYLLYSLNKERGRNLDLRVEGQNKQAAVEVKEREALATKAAETTKNEVIKYETARDRFRTRAKHTTKPDGSKGD